MRIGFGILFLSAGLSSLICAFGQDSFLTDPPEVRGPFTLTAVYDVNMERNSFAYNGRTVPPVIRVSPGGAITVRYVNDLPRHSDEACAMGPCSNISNLHFHGLHVSPERPQDDVLTMIARPGEALNYKVVVPSYSPPGLYWYHTHPHGESARQDFDGMSGAIVVDGIDRYYPELRHLRERVLILRDGDIEHADEARRKQILERVEFASSRCGTSADQTPERVFTVNGEIRPQISIGPGVRQFWRIVNASPDRYADLQVGGEQLEIVALDGMPLSYHSRSRGTRKVDHILVAPAGRVEAIVSGPPRGSRSTLSTRCVNTGPDGDFNPAMVIADLVSTAQLDSSMHTLLISSSPPIYKEMSGQMIEGLEAKKPDFIIVFTEDKDGFYINGKTFAMNADPMLRVHIGSMQHWRVINKTQELHPFHIHQVHFFAYAENGILSQSPEWLDTVNVPYGDGTVDLIMDFTDPIIQGMSVFHCHLLSHEDKGMMAKVLFQ
jgi:FtsP/CotA-like multicopper oxidase with cupredoxin domain